MDPLAFLTKELVVVDLQRPLRTEIVAEPAAAGRAPPDAAAALAAATRDYVGRTLLRGLRATAAIGAALAKQAERGFAHRIAALAAAGTVGCVLDLAVLHQLDDG